MEMRGIQAVHAFLKDELESGIREVFRHGRFIAGPEVAQLEKRLADYTGAAHCITCGNGTDALCLILTAMGIGSGDAVFLPGYTFFATAEAVLAVGAQPVLVDVRERDGNLDPLALKLALDRHTGTRPRAVIGVDLFGAPADWPAIRSVADKYGLHVIEDAAQSLGGHLGFKKCGSFGDAAALSFFPSKPLGGAGDGGAVLTGDAGLAETIRLYKDHGRSEGKYRHLLAGRNSRLDSLQAAVLLVKLGHLDAWTSACETVAGRYKAMLPPGALPLTPCESAQSAWAQFVVTLPSQDMRRSVMGELSRRAIPHEVYYPIPLNLQPALLHLRQSLPVCERLALTSLALPMHPFVTQEEQGEVAKAIRFALKSD